MMTAPAYFPTSFHIYVKYDVNISVACTVYYIGLGTITVFAAAG